MFRGWAVGGRWRVAAMAASVLLLLVLVTAGGISAQVSDSSPTATSMPPAETPATSTPPALPPVTSSATATPSPVGKGVGAVGSRIWFGACCIPRQLTYKRIDTEQGG